MIFFVELHREFDIIPSILQLRTQNRFSIIIHKMKANTCLLLKKYQLGFIMGAPRLHLITPLFQVKISRINTSQPLPKIVNNKKLNYTPYKLKDKSLQYDRIIVLHSTHSSNARRSVLINKQRSQIIEFINSKGDKDMLYNFMLNEITNLVPEECLMEQLQCMKNLRNWKNQEKSRFLTHSNESRSGALYNKALFPFNLREWSKILNEQLSRSKQRNFNTLKNTLLYIQVCNIYKIKYSCNREYLYKDICDFEKMLGKFNFIRFFRSATSDNQFMANKYGQKLIKSIKWRTQETEEYLLMMFRSIPWQSFPILLTNFIQIYSQNITHNKQIP